MNAIYSFLDIILPFEWASPVFMKNAFLAILVSCPVFGVLGTVVVSNKMSFFSDAIGHSALTGIALGVIMGIHDVMLSMILFSLMLGFAIVSVKVKGKASADTIIGVFSSTAVALGLVLLSANGNFSKYQKYLVGDILSIKPEEILMMLLSALVLALIWIFFYNKLLLVSLHSSFAKSRGVKAFFIEQIFAMLIAVIVTVSIRWTGLLVINSMLVLPAASSRMVSFSSRRYLFTSMMISLISGVVGLALSYYIDSASGACMVLVNAAIFIACFFVCMMRKK